MSHIFSAGSSMKQKALLVRRNRPERMPKGVTSVVAYGSLLQKLLAKLPPAVKAMKEANEAHEALLRNVIASCDIGAKGDSEFVLTVPDTRGELYYMEKRLRGEREMRVMFLIGDIYSILLFCKNLIPPNRDFVVKVRSGRLNSLGDAIADLCQKLALGKELYAVKTTELAAKHDEQLGRQKNCIRVMGNLLSKENNYVNILHMTDNSVGNVKAKGKSYLDKTTPDLAKELKRVLERHIDLYMQQRQRGILPTESTLSKADASNRTQYMPGKSSKVDELRYNMEQLAARMVPPGIQIQELRNVVLMRGERISKVDQMDAKCRDGFRQVHQIVKEDKNVVNGSKTLLTAIANYIANVIKELMDITQAAQEKREMIANKLNGLAARVKEKKDQCRPYKKIIRQFRPEITSLREDMVILSQAEAQLRYKLRMLLDQLNDVEKQRLDQGDRKTPTSAAAAAADPEPVHDEEIRLHQCAIEKVELRMSCIEKDREIKDILDLINRKRCHIKLQIGHLKQTLGFLLDELDNRNSNIDLLGADNARLEKYVADNEQFLKTVDEAIESCPKKGTAADELREIEHLERECEELGAAVEKLLQAPEEYYPTIRELEREIDAIRSRQREKSRNLRKMENALARRKELQDELKGHNQSAPDQLPALIEKDMQTVMEEVKSLQGKFEEVFNKNIQMKRKMIEQESLIDRYRRNIARLETDITVKELEMDKERCSSISRESSVSFYKKYQIEKGKQLPPSPSQPPPPPPPPSDDGAGVPGTSGQNLPTTPVAQPEARGTTPSSSTNDARQEWKKLYEKHLSAVPDTGVRGARLDDTELYVEEVRVKTTRTIRASPGFLFVQGMRGPLSGMGATQTQGAAAGGAGTREQTVSETVRPMTRDERIELLMAKTPIPESTKRQVQEDDSPDAQWVSYTDGRDIPTVLNTNLDQATCKLVQHIKKAASTSTTTSTTTVGGSGGSDQDKATSKPDGGAGPAGDKK